MIYMNYIRKFLFLIAVSSLFFATGCKKTQKDEVRTVRIAIQPSAAFIPLYIARYSHSLEEAAAKIDSLDSQQKSQLADALQIQSNQLLPIAQKYDYSVAITAEDKASLQDTISFLVTINNLPSEYKIEGVIDDTCYGK